MHTHYHFQRDLVRKIVVIGLLVLMATVELVGIKVLAKNSIDREAVSSGQLSNYFVK